MLAFTAFPRARARIQVGVEVAAAVLAGASRDYLSRGSMAQLYDLDDMKTMPRSRPARRHRGPPKPTTTRDSAASEVTIWSRSDLQTAGCVR